MSIKASFLIATLILAPATWASAATSTQSDDLEIPAGKPVKICAVRWRDEQRKFSVWSDQSGSWKVIADWFDPLERYSPPHTADCDNPHMKLFSNVSASKKPYHMHVVGTDGFDAIVSRPFAGYTDILFFQRNSDQPENPNSTVRVYF